MTTMEQVTPSQRSKRTEGDSFPPKNVVSDGEDNVVVIRTTEERLEAAQRLIATEIYHTNVVPTNLWYYNAVAGGFKILQAIILFPILEKITKEDWCWYTSYADPSDVEARGLVPHPVQIVSFSSLWLVPAYLFISGVEHMSYLIFPQTSRWYLERNQNPFRWTEYSLSAPFMKVVVAQQVGVTDVHLLVIIFVLMAVSVQCAATHEAVNAKARSENRPQNWRPFFVGWLGHLTGWSFIFSYLFALTSRGGASAALWIIVIMQMVLDSGFPVLFTMQWLKIGPLEDYVHGEKAFIVLSFVNKTLLAWLSLINAGLN